eukprot:275068_1
MANKSLTQSFSSNSVSQSTALRLWSEIKTVSIPWHKHFTPAQIKVILAVASESSSTMACSWRSIETLISVAMGLAQIGLSEKYSQRNGSFTLDIRMPSRRKSKMIGWMKKCLVILDERLDDLNGVRIANYKGGSGVLEDYSLSKHGGFLCTTSTFSQLGGEFTTFQSKAVITDEFKNMFVKFCNCSNGSGHTKFLLLHDQEGWLDGDKVVAPSLRFHMFGAIQPALALRFLKSATESGDGLLIRFNLLLQDPGKADFGTVSNTNGYSPEDFVDEILLPIAFALALNDDNILFGDIKEWDIGESPAIDMKWLWKQGVYIFEAYSNGELITEELWMRFKRAMSWTIEVVCSEEVEDDEEPIDSDETMLNVVLGRHRAPLDYVQFEGVCIEFAAISKDLLYSFIRLNLDWNDFTNYSPSTAFADSQWNFDSVRNHCPTAKDEFQKLFDHWEDKSDWKRNGDARHSSKFGKNPNMIARSSIVFSSFRQLMSHSLQERRDCEVEIEQKVALVDMKSAGYFEERQTKMYLQLFDLCNKFKITKDETVPTALRTGDNSSSVHGDVTSPSELEVERNISGIYLIDHNF